MNNPRRADICFHAAFGMGRTTSALTWWTATVFVCVISLSDTRAFAAPVISWEYDQLRPAVAYSEQAATYLVVWEDHHWGFGNDWDIYGQRLASNGAALGGAFGISFEGEQHRLAPAVTYNRDLDEFLVVWEFEYSSTT